jgi:hypothetical protein
MPQANKTESKNAFRLAPPTVELFERGDLDKGTHDAVVAGDDSDSGPEVVAVTKETLQRSRGRVLPGRL